MSGGARPRRIRHLENVYSDFTGNQLEISLTDSDGNDDTNSLLSILNQSNASETDGLSECKSSTPTRQFSRNHEDTDSIGVKLKANADLPSLKITGSSAVTPPVPITTETTQDNDLQETSATVSITKHSHRTENNSLSTLPESSKTPSPVVLDHSGESGAWEEWLAKKLKQQKAMLLSALETQNQKAEQAKVEDQKKAAKHQEADRKFIAWRDKKEKERKEHNRAAQESASKMEKVRCAKLEEKRQRGDQAFQQWVKTKKEEEQRKKEEEVRERQQILAQEKEKRQKNDKAFKDWLKRSQKRRPPTHSSFGYSSGRLTGYYDAACYPVPSFVNPVPWRDPFIPRKTTQKSRSH